MRMSIRTIWECVWYSLLVSVANQTQFEHLLLAFPGYLLLVFPGYLVLVFLVSIEQKLANFIKRCWTFLVAALVAIYNPNVHKLLFLHHCREQAKLLLISALEFVSNPFIKVCLGLPKDLRILKQLDIKQKKCLISQSVKESFQSTSRSSINWKAKDILQKQQVRFWISTFESWQF